MSALLICLLVAFSASACGDDVPQADASDLTAGNRAELVTLGGARLDPAHEQQVIVRVAAGELRIIAEVTGAAPSLECRLHRLAGEGDAAHWETVALDSSSKPRQHGAIFVSAARRRSSLVPTGCPTPAAAGSSTWAWEPTTDGLTAAGSTAQQVHQPDAPNRFDRLAAHAHRLCPQR